MTTTSNSASRAKRILVAIDTSARGRAALKAAVQLALNTSAELQGLFVEDEDLVRLASLPFSHEIDFASAAPRELQSVNVERALRAAAEEAHQAFADALQQLNLHWTFRVVRGTITQASLAAAGDFDLLVIGQQGRSPRIMAGDYFRKQSGTSKRVVVVFDGSPSSVGALELASSLAKPAPILVLVSAKDGDEISRDCISWLGTHHVRAEVHRALSPSQDAIIDFVRKSPPSVLLINRDSEIISNSLISRLVDEFDCPLILC